MYPIRTCRRGFRTISWNCARSTGRRSGLSCMAFDTETFLRFFRHIIKLSRARSQLYQRRSLQPNTHFSAFFEIYKFCNPLHRSDLKNSVKNRQNFCEIEYWIFNRNFSFFSWKMLFLVEIEMKFCRNFANMLKNVQIHLKFQKFCNFSRKIREISGIYREIQSKNSIIQSSPYSSVPFWRRTIPGASRPRTAPASPEVPEGKSGTCLIQKRVRIGLKKWNEIMKCPPIPEISRKNLRNWFFTRFFKSR